MKRLIDPLREDKSSYQMAKETAQIILDIAQSSKYQSVQELTKTINKAGKMILEENPLEFSIENVIRKIISLIKDINEQNDKKKNKGFSNLKKLFEKEDANEELAPANVEDKEEFKVKRTKFIDAIQGLLQELDDLSDTINDYAANHINSGEVILTYGYSETIKLFLIDAKKQRNFEVIVLEGECKQSGQKMAQDLANEGITTSLIPFSSAYAFMSRVNKVFIGAHAIMKNGGVLGRNGILMLTTAAKAYSVPVIVLASAIKLTPHFPFEQNTFNETLNPQEMLPNTVSYNNNETIIVTRFDYVAPEYINLYITNYGEHTPAYIYRLFNEYYPN
ncbi:hypothetical protein ABPG72_010270 [Tetrahymena utriculariae]